MGPLVVLLSSFLGFARALMRELCFLWNGLERSRKVGRKHQLGRMEYLAGTYSYGLDERRGAPVALSMMDAAAQMSI